MHETLAEVRTIDLKTWHRTQLYELFKTFSEPYHGVCLRIDCTETFRYAKRHGCSMFLTLVHRALTAVNQVESLKTRIVGEDVVQYPMIHGGGAVGRPNETISFGFFHYRPCLQDFLLEAAAVLQRVKDRTDIERSSRQDLVRFSILPWLDFTSISHARSMAGEESAPRITFGKVSENADRCTMPISIHVHHALADGLHVAQFVEQFERCLREPEL